MLDLCCGAGGWTNGFLPEGFECDGVDIADMGYKGNLIKQDIFDFMPTKKYDVVCASPECKEFSIIKSHIHGTQSERRGLDMVYRCLYLIREVIKPKYWVVENVKGLSHFLGEPRHKVRYDIKARSKVAYLWGNFPDLGMFEYLPVYGYRHFKNNHDRAMIPFPLANEMAKRIKAAMVVV